MSGFSQLELDELRALWSLLDVQGNGQVSVDSIRQVLSSLQADTPNNKEGAYPLMSKLEDQLNKNNYSNPEEQQQFLDFSAFLELFEGTSLQNTLQESAQKLNYNDSDDEDPSENFAHVFALFDTNHKGYISIQDLERVAKELGEHDITQQELQEMMDRGGGSQQHKKGRVNLQEFTKLMTMDLFHKKEGSENVTTE